jgi:hypothetical protein
LCAAQLVLVPVQAHCQAAAQVTAQVTARGPALARQGQCWLAAAAGTLAVAEP